jgi:hypothetical protein
MLTSHLNSRSSRIFPKEFPTKILYSLIVFPYYIIVDHFVLRFSFLFKNDRKCRPALGIIHPTMFSIDSQSIFIKLDGPWLSPCLCLLSRLNPYLDKIIVDHQCGFRTNDRPDLS